MNELQAGRMIHLYAKTYDYEPFVKDCSGCKKVDPINAMILSGEHFTVCEDHEDEFYKRVKESYDISEIELEKIRKRVYDRLRYIKSLEDQLRAVKSQRELQKENAELKEHLTDSLTVLDDYRYCLNMLLSVIPLNQFLNHMTRNVIDDLRAASLKDDKISRIILKDLGLSDKNPAFNPSPQNDYDLFKEDEKFFEDENITFTK